MNGQVATEPAPRRVAIYQRVSSETQRERETIKTQKEALDRAVLARPDIEVVRTYVDDGVSGMVPFALRPEGTRLLADAPSDVYDEVWVYRFDRVGRDEIDALVLRRDLETCGVSLYSTTEGEARRLTFGMHMLMAAEERDAFLARSAEGMNRAAKEGRYCGGIVPYGYRVEGHKNTARLVPAEDELPGCLMSQAEVVRHMYQRLASDGWACRRIAKELNSLGVPTKYALEGRGLRGERTQGLWGAGRIRNMVVNPTYKGKALYGRRTLKRREVIAASVEPLVTEELWQAAQETLARNRASAKNTYRTYLLRGVIHCGNCGRAYNGSQHNGDTWYRCNGTLNRTELVGKRCQAKILRGDFLEELIWSDIERFLKDPGDMLGELEAEAETDPARQALESERARWQAARDEWQARRERLLQLYEGGHRTKQEMEARLGPILDSLAQANDRLASLSEQEEELEPVAVNEDLLDEIQRQLDEGLSDERRGEIVRLLVKNVTVDTDVGEDGNKTQRVFIEYRFPRVSATHAGKPASQDYTARIYRRTIALPSGRQRKAKP